MEKTTALILAGGINLGFSVLTHNRAKSALPFAGHLRVIDFALTNLSYSGFNHVGILIQYLPGSLIDHVGVGSAWDFATVNRKIKLMPPFIGMGKTNWFRGSADAIYQNLNYVDDTKCDHVLVLSADHIYRMDYRPLLDYHRRHNSDLTIVTVDRPDDTPPEHFGYVTSDADQRVQSFVEKPVDPPHTTVSTGIYLFNAEVLKSRLRGLDSELETHDLPRSVVEPLVDTGRVFSWHFEGPWDCLPDLRAYVQLHHQFLCGDENLFSTEHPLVTNLEDRDLGSRPSPYFGRLSNVQQSYVSPGCRVEGTVVRSVLSPGVYVAPRAHVEDAILMHDCEVHEGSVIRGVVSDKDVVFEPFSRVGEPGVDMSRPELRDMTVVGKGARFCQGVRVGSGKEVGINRVVQSDWETHHADPPWTPPKEGAAKAGA